MRRYGPFYLAALLTLAQAAVALLVERPAPPLLALLALAASVPAVLFTFWPMFVLLRQGSVPPGATYMATTAVVDGGPYAIVRHPQYLGYMLINACFMLSNPHWSSLLLGGAAIACFYHHARREERRLGPRFGAAYERYARRVPAFNAPLGVLRLLR